MNDRKTAERAELEACLALAMEYLEDASEEGDAEGMRSADNEIMGLVEALEALDA